MLMKAFHSEDLLTEISNSTFQFNIIVDLRTPLDEDFLLIFLRARKFKANKAYDLIVTYYTIRQQHPDIFTVFTPASVRRVFERGAVLPLPRQIPLRPLTILVRVCKYNYTNGLFKDRSIPSLHNNRNIVLNCFRSVTVNYDLYMCTKYWFRQLSFTV